MIVLKTNNLRKQYGKITALNNLNLSIENGQIFGLLGPNGSGKTTTLGIILGVLLQNSGDFVWFENKYKNPRIKIGSILETPNFYPYLNAVENLKIIERIKQARDTNFDEILEIVNLSHRKKSKFRTYSLGMKQRLAIGATLIGNPEVLIFDEPTNGLDPEGIAEVRRILSDIAQRGKTVILASHILDEVEKICSHVAIIKNGKLLASGSVGNILDSNLTVEINALNRDNLSSELKGSKSIISIEETQQYFECKVDENTDIDEFAKHLHEKGIIVNHFKVRRNSLEEEFLKITK